jgi:hypothetical protein
VKRLHLHVSAPDLAQSIQFYGTLFGVGILAPLAGRGRPFAMRGARDTNFGCS